MYIHTATWFSLDLTLQWKIPCTCFPFTMSFSARWDSDLIWSDLTGPHLNSSHITSFLLLLIGDSDATGDNASQMGMGVYRMYSRGDMSVRRYFESCKVRGMGESQWCWVAMRWEWDKTGWREGSPGAGGHADCVRCFHSGIFGWIGNGNITMTGSGVWMLFGTTSSDFYPQRIFGISTPYKVHFLFLLDWIRCLHSMESSAILHGRIPGNNLQDAACWFNNLASVPVQRRPSSFACAGTLD